MESFIGWIGGKRMLRKAILERFPTDEVGRYIEVFGGAAWVLFAKMCIRDRTGTAITRKP